MLAHYVRDLLYRYDKVIIPDFGAIITETVSAKIDEERNTFVPPTKNLKFDPFLTEDDGLLTNYISSKDNSSQDAARNFINFELDEWKKKLAHQDLELEDIGTFSLDNFGNYIFIANDKSNFLVDSFGLSNMELNEPERSESERKIILAKENQIHELDKPKKIKHKKKNKTGNFFSKLVYSVLFLFLLIFGWFFGKIILENNAQVEEYKKGLDKQDKLIKSQFQDAVFELDSTLPALILKVGNNPIFDSIVPAEKSIDSTKIKVQLVPKKTPPKPESNITDIYSKKTDLPTEKPQTENTENTEIFQITGNPELGKYYIIAGSYKDPANAISRVKELKNSGYNALIVSRETDFIQVSYGLYTSEAEVGEAFKKIKKINRDAWVLAK